MAVVNATGYKSLSPFLNNAAWQIKIKILLPDFYRIHFMRSK